MRVQTEAPTNVLKAPENGDVLRIARSVHPTSVRVGLISDVEAAVAESAARLERAARHHQRQLSRLAVLRHRAGLDTSPVLSVDELIQPNVPDNWLVGRIVEREPLTMESKTSGKLLLVTGQILNWTAGAHYVDTLDQLFDGVPVMFTGIVKHTQDNDVVYCIGCIKPAPPEFWPASQMDDYQAATECNASLIEQHSNARKTLREQHGSRCLDCKQYLSKPSKASLIPHDTGYRLVCRPCKQAWIDAGRPVLTSKAVTV